MPPASPFHELRLWLGIERSTTSHGEKWISGIGALLGIVAVYWITRAVFPNGFTTTPGGALMLTSMGASAVLLFAVPLGALSQPWAVVAGHLVSAVVGVSCQKLFPGETWTAALAVGLAVGAMHYLRCIHPPGGATALAAVEPASTGAEGYAFLTELVRRFTRAGYKVVETPIVFRDRTAGRSKMSGRIIAESMLLVTRWGLRDLLTGRRRGR